MAKTDLSIPSLGKKYVDLRDSIPGDSYNFSWVRPLSQVNYLAIHHSNGPDTKTPDEIAEVHINNNGWGGIGYHFLIAKDGTVFYVGDISTARANVANLNEQVLGICIIGNFTEGRSPSSSQLDSANKLCDFFINNYPDLSNVNSWDKLRGHKELPGQSTPCPGDNWPEWRIQIVEGVSGPEVDTPDPSILESQVNNLQTSLASVNQQLIFLQEALQEREQEINILKAAAAALQPVLPQPAQLGTTEIRVDTTLTIVGALINLYQIIFPPGKADAI